MPIGEQARIAMANRFEVLMDHGAHNLGSWSKVQGLDVSWDVVEYRAGDAGNDRWYFPGNTKYQTIKLERAACEDSTKVRDWLSATSFKHGSHGGSVVLLDATGKKVMEWELRDVMPAKWSISGFEAMQSKVALETLELMHRGFLDDQIKF
ncbi:phage tail protein [Allokutzneria sp. NRRL B-24872]|uniref:phage tail protein n=1 Tax=Allokutzneria sp. NRRL B-24872 TaxID=1137961 RepID=UPI000A395741|nr:phage tail protein [Allokutzneria sp. NRRL B-24872]